MLMRPIPPLSGAGPAPLLHPRLEVEGEHPGKMTFDPRPYSPLVEARVLIWRNCRSVATRLRTSERPFGNTRQICGSRSPMRWATAHGQLIWTHFGGHSDYRGGDVLAP
jgi:hypothetical protein